MECKHNKDELCTNDQCPMCADYCPVPNTDGVCKYEELEYMLTPKGCLASALLNAGIQLSDTTFNYVWEDFSALMIKLGYVQEDQ